MARVTNHAISTTGGTSSKNLKSIYIKYLKVAASVVTNAMRILAEKALYAPRNVPSAPGLVSPDPGLREELRSVKEQCSKLRLERAALKRQLASLISRFSEEARQSGAGAGDAPT